VPCDGDAGFPTLPVSLTPYALYFPYFLFISMPADKETGDQLIGLNKKTETISWSVTQQG
jgi:hypothetical protein